MSALDFLFDEANSSSIAAESVDYVLDSVQQSLEDKEIAKLEVPYATELAMAKLFALIDLATLEYDGLSTAEEPFEKYSPDGEPYPGKIDSWARGIVTTRKVVTEEMQFGRGGVPSVRSNAPSVSSYRSSVTGRSRQSKFMRSASSRGSERSMDKPVDPTGQIIELDDPDSEFGNLNATGFMFDVLQKNKRKKEKGYFTPVDEEDEKGEFDLLQEQITKVTKETRGKKFVLDRYGQPVILGSVDPKRLPSLTTTPNLTIKDDKLLPPPVAYGSKPPTANNNAGNNVGQQQQQQQQQQSMVDKKRQFVRVAGSRGVEESSFQPTLSLATTLSGVDTIPKVNPGVVVRSKSSMKKGETLADDPKHISKKTYLSKSQQLQSQSHSYASPHQSQSTLYPIGAQTLDGRSTHTTDSKNNAAVGMRDASAIIDNLPDFDRFEGAKKVVFVDERRDLTDAELGLGQQRDNSMSSISPARLPAKPSEKQESNILLLRGSPEHGKPKDRDAPKNVHFVSQRKHLPAPPLGHIAGHGLTLDKFIERAQNISQQQQGSGELSPASISSDWHQQWRN